MRHKRSYRYRMYPTDAQAATLERTFGCVRYVYNWGLHLRSDAYSEQSERLGYRALSAHLTLLKQQPETLWLSEVSSVPLQQSLRHLESAFRNFFEGRAAYPTFKKKRGRQSATYASSAFTWDASARNVKLAKMETPLNIRWSRAFSGVPITITVSRDTAGRYFISFLVEEDIAEMPLTEPMIGIDLGIKDLVIISTGEKIPNPRHLDKNMRRLKRAQQALARKQKGSKNCEKARRKVARIHSEIADQRLDNLHKVTTRLIRENQVICVESLKVKNLLRNHSLARATSDAGWGELVRQLEYKAKWYGRSLIKIDRWYPSSKRCFDCGYVLDVLTLDVREWTCPQCGALHDRDVNAAKNIRAVGHSVLASGEMISPTLTSVGVDASR